MSIYLIPMAAGRVCLVSPGRLEQRPLRMRSYIEQKEVNGKRIIIYM